MTFVCLWMAIALYSVSCIFPPTFQMAITLNGNWIRRCGSSFVPSYRSNKEAQWILFSSISTAAEFKYEIDSL